MDEDLRAAIDRLIAVGGRLTVHPIGPNGTTVVLEQPGARFGILEVRGRATVDGDDAESTARLLEHGWTDPTITHRLGREIRVGSAASTDGASRTLTRTWRVPPNLASEIVDDLSTAVGPIGQLDGEPLQSRDRAPTPSPTPPPPVAHEVEEEGRPDVGPPSRTVPAPVLAILAVASVAVIAIVWGGMIRGAPRVPDVGAAASLSPVQPSASVVSPSMPAATALVATPGPAAIRSHVAGASTEDDSGPASAAIDGDPVTAWHAAFGVPQWIELDLDEPATVNEVVLVIAQAKDGPTRHMIQVAVTGQALQVVGVVDRHTFDGDKLFFRPDDPIENVERIRIETLASPSNAGWYEVIVR